MRRHTKKVVLDNFREHVRAVAEISGKAIIGTADGIAELATVIERCERLYKQIVYNEALHCLGLAAGRSARRRIAKVKR